MRFGRLAKKRSGNARELDALGADDLAFKTEVPYAAFRIEHEERRANQQRDGRLGHVPPAQRPGDQLRLSAGAQHADEAGLDRCAD